MQEATREHKRMGIKKYIFSGHESFTCKSLWLKKGYDFIKAEKNFNAPEAVVQLGVGKNMVTSIRYWMKAFGMTNSDQLTNLSEYLLDTDKGKDPFIEDLGTLWLLHFMLVSKCEASLYYLLFTRMQRERKTFDRQQVVNFVKRTMTEDNKYNLYNENTVKKDVAVLLQNYVLPQKSKALDDYSALLIDLDLIRLSAEGKEYIFNIEGKRLIPWQIFLYAVLSLKGDDNTVSYDLLQEIGLMFCMNDMEVIEMCKIIEAHRHQDLRYSDTAGIRQLQFINDINGEDILNDYYDKESI